MITASALKPHCGYAAVLEARRPRSEKLVIAGQRGGGFHGAVERWAKDGEPPTIDGDLEAQGWLDLLASQWSPPRGAMFELAWGLSPEGEYVAVDEPEPHKYVARNGSQLLTAGRADVCWVADPARLLVVADWKTGAWPVTEAHANLQVNAAGRALAKWLECPAYAPAIYYARDGFWDWGVRVWLGSPNDTAMFAAVREAALLDETPRPGPWCGRCWQRKNCAFAQQ